ncbi:hypothetical protein TIFTF001_028088 [Ficus carica]|uniref:Uncharacterized protein n=1 Tax=Ficus carica TaxID=3494 RepID=A0AA88IZL7_FICCA|nr:hypothetical protein TIFTF001_028088 [Ficus carica]
MARHSRSPMSALFHHGRGEEIHYDLLYTREIFLRCGLVNFLITQGRKIFSTAKAVSRRHSSWVRMSFMMPLSLRVK